MYLIGYMNVVDRICYLGVNLVGFALLVTIRHVNKHDENKRICKRDIVRRTERSNLMLCDSHEYGMISAHTQ